MTRAYRILCIEDDPRLRRLLTEDLVEAGYVVEAAADARAGQAAFFEHAPALVLCDIRMPGISGFDLIERLRALDVNLFGTIFIFLTALADRDNELRGRRLGADDYITKPVDYEILREVVRMRLSGREPGPPPDPLDPRLAAALKTWFDMYGTGSERQPDVAELRRRFPEHRHAQTQPDASPFSNMLNDFPLGLIVIDAKGMLRYVNESAASMLGRPRPELHGSRASSHLLDFAREHSRSDRARPGGFSANRIIVAVGGDPTTAVARSMRGGEHGGVDGSVAIVLPRLPACLPPLSDLLRTLFDLTPAEGLVATQVGTGVHLSDVAEQRGVAVATIRTQLKSVFDKMGVTRQSELVRAMASLQMAAGFGEP